MCKFLFMLIGLLIFTLATEAKDINLNYLVKYNSTVTVHCTKEGFRQNSQKPIDVYTNQYSVERRNQVLLIAPTQSGQILFICRDWKDISFVVDITIDNSSNKTLTDIELIL